MDASFGSESRSTGRPRDDRLAAAVREHGPWLLRWFESRVPPTIDPEDLTQDVFVILSANWSRVRDPERLGAYLVVIARRVRRRATRRSAREVESIRASAEDLIDVAVGGADEELARALRSLPDELAMAVASYYAGGGTYELAARRIGVSRATLQSRLRRALSTLRSKLKADGSAVRAATR